MDCRIERIEIVSFGKLKNVSLDLREGINLLSAPNESGKSTLAAFLRFALYGFSDGRKQSIAENDRKLYTPWEQPRAEGSLLVRSGETLYRVFRSCSGTKEQLEVTDVSTGKPALDGQIPGKALLGVSEDVFSRTLFFRQAVPSQNRDEVLAEQLQTLAVSADEQIGSGKATEQLRKAQNALRGRAGSGVLPKLEEKSAKLGAELTEALADHETLNGLRSDAEKARALLEENRASREKLEAEMRDLTCFEAGQTLLRVQSAKEESEREDEAYRLASSELQTRGEDDAAFLASLISRNASLRALRERKERLQGDLEKVGADLRECENGMNERQARNAERAIKTNRAFWIAAFVAAVACGAAALLLPGMRWLFAAAGGLLCAGVILFFLGRKIPQKYGCADVESLREEIRSVPAKQEKKNALLARETELRNALSTSDAEEQTLRGEVEQGIRSYRAEPGTDYDVQLQQLLTACNRLSELKYRADNAKRNYDALVAGLDLPALEELAKHAPDAVRERAVVEREETFYRKQGELLAEKKQSLDLQLAALEARVADPSLLTGKKRAIDERIAEYRGKLASYEAAKAGIEQAADQMKSMVAPRISALSGSYFAGATGGKYDALDVDTRLAMNTRESGMTHDLDYLSAGTKDVAFLSLRLALADMLFGGSGVPMVLDDAFGRLDDERLSATLSLLADAAKRHQLLLLTCTDREETMLQTKKISYHKLEQKG